MDEHHAGTFMARPHRLPHPLPGKTENHHILALARSHRADDARADRRGDSSRRHLIRSVNRVSSVDSREGYGFLLFFFPLGPFRRRFFVS